jgi:hypothetical protein
LIIKLEQTKTNFDLEYVFEVKEKTIATFSAPFTRGYFEGGYRHEETLIVLSLDFKDTFAGESMQSKMGFKLYNDSTKTSQIGSIIFDTVKTGKAFLGIFGGGYVYTKLTLNDEVFKGYEVGFGNKGLYFCIYKDDVLIAIADKALTTINFKDTYTIYLAEEQYINAVLIFITHFDLLNFGDMMDIATASISRTTIHTGQKEIIAKYDPTFIPRIKAMEENN